MRRWLLLAATIALFCVCAFAETKTSLWNVKKSDHFIIYYRGASPEYIDRVAKEAERNYHDITGELGFTRYDGFWTWEARVKIYLYDTREAYIKETKHSQWSGAHVNVIARELYAYVNMEDFFSIILPHELGHIIFREFVGFKRDLPLWMDEGVVSYLEKAQKAERLMVARAVAKTSYFVPLSQLNKSRPGAGMMPDVFYAEAASIIEFLITTYGKDEFFEFCERLKGLRFDQGWFDAAAETYNFKTLGDMNKKWMEWLADED